MIPARDDTAFPDWVFPAALGSVLVAIAAVTWQADYLGTDDWFLVDFGRHPLDWERLFSLRREGTPAIRPLALAMARLEWLLFGDACLPRRLVYLALHGVTAELVRRIARSFATRQGAALTGLLFALWPFHGETLAWYHSAETAIPFTTLTFLALWSWLSDRRSLAVGVLIAALLVRENAVVIAPLIVLLGIARGSTVRAAIHAARLPIILTTAYVGLRVLQVSTALGEHKGATLPFAENPLESVGELLFHLAVPVQPAIGSAWAWLLAAVALTALSLIRGRRALPAGLLWCLLFALPFLPLYDSGDPVFAVHSSVYERRWYHLYPLAAGLAWIGAAALDRTPRWLQVSSLAAVLSLCLVNAHFWAGFGPSLRAAQAQVGGMVDARTGVGLALRDEVEAPIEAELVEHRVLDLSRALARPVVVYKRDAVGTLARSAPDALGYPRWVPVHRIPESEKLKWIQWDAATDTFNATGSPTPGP